MSTQVDSSPEILLIAKEASAAGCSEQEYVDRVISELFKIPVIFEDSHLKEVITYSRIFGDKAMQYLPSVAEKQRRHPDQVLLWLLEESQKASHQTLSLAQDVIQLSSHYKR